MRATDELVFGAHQQIGPALNGISCPSLRLCAAVDSHGEVITSSDLTRARPQWSTAAITSGGGLYLNAISCPSTQLCVAVDSSGRVVTTTHPTGAAAGWTTAVVDGSNDIRAISCPSRTLCVAADDAGNIVTSTNPTGGATGWTATHIPATRHLTSISCPTPQLCVATAEAAHGGTLLVSANPTAGPRSWAVLTGLSPHPFESVSCPSVRYCVATDWAGYATWATHPLGGRRAWKFSHIDPVSHPVPHSSGFMIPAIACHGTGFCVAVDDVGKAIWSVHPSGGVTAWTISKRPDGTQPFRGIACPSARLCIAIDNDELLTINKRPG